MFWIKFHLFSDLKNRRFATAYVHCCWLLKNWIECLFSELLSIWENIFNNLSVFLGYNCIAAEDEGGLQAEMSRTRKAKARQRIDQRSGKVWSQIQKSSGKKNLLTFHWLNWSFVLFLILSCYTDMLFLSNRKCSKPNDFVFQCLGGLQDSSWQVLLGARRLRAEDDFGGQTLSGGRGLPPQADEGVRWELLPDCRQQQQSSREGETPTFSDFNSVLGAN